MATTILLSHKAEDARVAMASLIEARSLSYHEEDEGYPAAIAALAWKIADAMATERFLRSRGER